MTLYTFQEVPYYAMKSGICGVCKKCAMRKRKFWQTLNPFNKTADGEIKTVKHIRDELRREAQAWENEPLYHVKCQPREVREP